MRIVIAEDSVLLREGLAALVSNAGHEVVAAVTDADQLIREVNCRIRGNEVIDLVITDVRMPPTGTDDGIRAAIALREHHPDLAVLVLSAYVAGPYLPGLLMSGRAGVGYLLKERVGNVDYFLSTFGVVAAGGVVVDPEVVSHQVNGAPRVLQSLTTREREVLQLMAEGRSNREIGQELFVSVPAVSKHVANIFLKLGMLPGEENRRVRAVLTWLQGQQ